MQIPQQLPQFEDEKTLLIVSGNQSGLFYIAQNGMIEKINEMSIETPKYSDKEGFSSNRSTNMGVISSGSSTETDKHVVWNKFIKEASEYISELHKKSEFEKIWLYCAPEIINDFRKGLPGPVASLVEKEFRGTYLKLSPVELLELSQK
ncbi:MAG: host attachment protein [bacterium]|nr:host attachment protein [bacterium]